MGGLSKWAFFPLYFFLIIVSSEAQAGGTPPKPPPNFGGVAPGPIIPAPGDPLQDFAIFVGNSFLMHDNVTIFGDVGASTRGVPDRPFLGGFQQMTVRGGRLFGAVYGDSVFLGENAVVDEIYADFLFQEGVSRSTPPSRVRVPDGPYPVLPEDPLVQTVRFEAGEHIAIPPGRQSILQGSIGGVVIEEGGSGVLLGGEVRIGELIMRRDSSLIATAPTTLYIGRVLRTEDRVYLGSVSNLPTVNLRIFVAGSDTRLVPRVQIGDYSTIRGIMSIPQGIMSLGRYVEVVGSLVGRDVEVGSHSVVTVDPSLLLDFAQCVVLSCEGSGANDPRACSFEALPLGTRCDDGNACTGGSLCDGFGTCLPGSLIDFTNFDDVCLVADVENSCSSVSGPYLASGTVCDTSVQCREPTTCDGTGNCRTDGAPLAAGSICDDGVAGNGPDTCNGFGGCSGALGSGTCVDNLCSSSSGEAPDLACWFTTHEAIRDAIRWQFPNDGFLKWTDWDSAAQDELQQSFEDAWTWLSNGLGPFPGPLPPDPAPNILPANANGSHSGTRISEAHAWAIYKGTVAHSLAVEIMGVLPWSMCDYNDQGTFQTKFLTLLDGENMFAYVDDPNFPGYGPNRTNWLVAHPFVTYSFLVDNGIIGSTRLETIANLINWARRMSHSVGLAIEGVTECLWQAQGFASVSTALSGTNFDVGAVDFSAGTLQSCAPSFLRHWTGGCGPTSHLFKDVLRAVNIPALATIDPQQARPHFQPYFITEGSYLTHGDNPYDAMYREGTQSPVPPLEMWLVDEATKNQWFAEDDDLALTRNLFTLAVQYPPDSLMDAYCMDLASGADHAGGKVAEFFQDYFSVAELEAEDLWTRLAAQDASLGFCN